MTGCLQNTNTLDAFKELDKKQLLYDIGKQVLPYLFTVGNRDILHQYVDGTDKNMCHFSLILNEFLYGKVLGPVVQSIVSLMSSLRGQLVKRFTTL